MQARIEYISDVGEAILTCLDDLVCEDNLSFMKTLEKGRTKMKLIVTSPLTIWARATRRNSLWTITSSLRSK